MNSKKCLTKTKSVGTHVEVLVIATDVESGFVNLIWIVKRMKYAQHNAVVIGVFVVTVMGLM